MVIFLHLSVEKFCANKKLTHQPCNKNNSEQSNQKDVPYLLSLNANASEKLASRHKFRIGDFVRISKIDLPFRKGYKQTFTNEVFEVYDIPTINPPTYSLIDSNQNPISGKFYQLELVKVADNSEAFTKHA